MSDAGYRQALQTVSDINIIRVTADMTIRIVDPQTLIQVSISMQYFNVL